MAPRESGPPIRKQSSALLCAFVVVWAVICAGWWSTAGTWTLEHGKNDLRLLELQVEAFAHGSLSLEVTPDPKLLALTNPYDPEQNRGVRLLDAVLFEGKYYTYFAPAPLVLFMLPYFVVVGAHLPAPLFAWVLGAATFLFNGLAIINLSRRWFPESQGWKTLLLLFAAPACTALPPLLVSHETFDIPVLAGVAFSSASVFFLVRAYARPSSTTLDFLLASTVAGLACASRSVLIPVFVGILGVCALLPPHREGSARRRWASLAAPLGAILFFLGLYNFLRFGSLFDFGNKYTLVEIDWTKVPAFDPAYVVTNAFYYIASLPSMSDSFPFFLRSGPSPFELPAGYLASYIDRMGGIAILYPIYLAAFGLLFGTSARGKPLTNLTSALGVGLCVLALLLFCFVGSSIRYQAELMSGLFPLATLGLLSCLNHRSVGLRRAAAVPALVAGAITLVSTTAMASVGERGILARNREAVHEVSSVSNSIVFAVKNALGVKPRIPVVTFQLPIDQFGKSEPLWVEGRPAEANFLYLYYASPTTIRFGFEVMGRGGPLSAEIPIDYNRPHRLEIISGRFLPPPEHPFFSELEIDASRPPQSMLRLVLDGVPVFETKLAFHDGRQEHFWGESPYEPAFGTRFTGTLRLEWEDFKPDQYTSWKAALTAGESR